MITLLKSAKPQVLVDNEEQWAAALTKEVPTAAQKTRYRHPQIKTALVAETNGKCAYCESKLLHIHHGDVEHIYPKSLASEKTFEWQNLTLACEICNQNKSNKDPLFEHIIDPYLVNPSEHLLFVGSLLYPKGTKEGTNTLTLLDLNRIELVERRNERLKGIMAIVYAIYQNDLPLVTRRDIFFDLESNEASAKGQYSAMVRTIVELIRGNSPTAVTT